MKNQEKTYRFVFEDRSGNELQIKETSCKSLKEAKELAKNLKANSTINDLHKIIVSAK
jgi:hypothetical protein